MKPDNRMGPAKTGSPATCHPKDTPTMSEVSLSPRDSQSTTRGDVFCHQVPPDDRLHIAPCSRPQWQTFDPLLARFTLS
jgi:hypothetical protein